MEMIEVKSSNVAAIGYAPDVQLLRVRFHNGTTYDYPAVSADRYARLMATESKGKHLWEHFSGAVRSLADGGEIKLKEPYVVGETPCEQTLKETFAEDSCCRRRLMAMDRAGLRSWECPSCGCLWEWRMIGEIRHWAVREDILIW